MGHSPRNIAIIIARDRRWCNVYEPLRFDESSGATSQGCSETRWLTAFVSLHNAQSIGRVTWELPHFFGSNPVVGKAWLSNNTTLTPPPSIAYHCCSFEVQRSLSVALTQSTFVSIERFAVRHGGSGFASPGIWTTARNTQPERHSLVTTQQLVELHVLAL